MKYKISFTILLIFVSVCLSSAQNTKLDTLLFEKPDIIFQKLDSNDTFEATYKLMIRQPLDHADTSKGYFYQKVYLSHQGFDRPAIIVTEGYQRDKNRKYELTEYLDANQIQVEHRFFGESIPDSLDYQYLNLKQATADLHHIKQLFSSIYTNKWISTGISKGGATTIFYRYFYPDDVDVSVPYVAPINRELEEKRLYKFLDTIGSDECREKIRSFQLKVLSNRDKVLPLLKFYSKGGKHEYTYLSFEEAFEYTVLEYPFSFWQYAHDCDEIPDATATVETMVTYLMSISDIGFFSDKQIKKYGSHYYQAAQEMGYYGYETNKFKGYLLSLPNDKNPQATFVPNKMEVDFDGQLLKDVNNWLDKGVDRMIYINGALDTWSASAVPYNKKGDSEWFFLKDKGHAKARIKNMTAKEKLRFKTALEKWLSLQINE